MTPIDDYILLQDPLYHNLLFELRDIFKEVLPEATEKISFNMPAFAQNKVLLYFALCKKHIGIYPTPSAMMFFADDIKVYKCSKGAFQLPLNQPLPKELLQKIALFRLAEDSK